ncbi:DUF4349 domain-containing protein [Streptomyces sp. NPDC093261]|uniref:DUF4349 domain-containing protein n=1 Tax=Streptomyces sp. NPDC093261 TaxID=3366037 RepID=UPI0037F855F3
MHTPRSARPVRALAATLLVAALALAGCGAAGDDTKSTTDAGGAKAAASGAQGQGAAGGGAGGGSRAGGAVPRLTDAIIRTASLTVRVKDVPKALDEARTTAENAGGYVGSENTSRDLEGHERTRLVLRVPTGTYDEVLAALEGAGTLVERTARAEDVTDQVVDVDSRVKSQRAGVARVRELMDRATGIRDVVALEDELNTRQADLEALLARQASLKDRTGLATITLSLSAPPVRNETKKSGPGFLDALAGGWRVFVTLLRWIALAIGAALPFAVLAALLVLLWVRAVRPRPAGHGAVAPTADTAPGPDGRPGRDADAASS